MRLVLDPNALIAAFVARGQCHEVLEHAARAHHLLASEVILAQLPGKLIGKLGARTETVEGTLDLLRSRMTMVEISPLQAPSAATPTTTAPCCAGLDEVTLEPLPPESSATQALVMNSTTRMTPHPCCGLAIHRAYGKIRRT